jgi:citronellol/citronellal dehydrogenase
MEMLGGGEDIANMCRKPEIMADAAYIILTRDARNFTGNFVIDEEILKEEGVRDFDQVKSKLWFRCPSAVFDQTN